MPDQVKSLADFYDPTRSAQIGLQYMQGQQMLAGQAEARAQQGRNMEIDNLRQALQAANPMESYPLYKRLMEMNGQEAPPVNAYYANTEMYNKLISAEPGTEDHTQAMAAWVKTSPGSRAVIEKEVGTQRAFSGAQELNVAAGLGGSENLAELTRQMPAVQKQVAEVVAQDPLKQMQIKEHEQVAANVNTQLGALVPMMKAANLAIERTTPHVEQLAVIQEQYDKDLKSKGLTAAAGSRRERILANPELQAFSDRRMQSIPKLEQAVQQLEDQRNQLETQAELVARGVNPLKEGESLAVLAGKVDASSHQLAYHKAQLAFAKDPSKANLNALKAVKDGIDQQVTLLTEKKNASADALAVRRDAQQETARKNRQGEAYTNATAQGQTLFGSLPASRQTTNEAARIAKEIQQSTGVKVKVEDILIKDPNRPTTQVNFTEEKQESKTVGTGFGEQYLASQKSGMAATGKLNKLDRMDSLLSGITTGKLTPALTDIAAIGESFGISIDKTLPAKQAMQALSREMALELRNPAGGAGMPGAMSDQDREFLQSMTPGLATTNEGNKLIIETARKVAKRDQEIAKLARTYRQQKGHLDEGFYDQVQAYGDAHPMFKGQNVPQGTAERTTPNVTSEADYQKLPPGSTYTAPDGSIRRKK